MKTFLPLSGLATRTAGAVVAAALLLAAPAHAATLTRTAVGANTDTYGVWSTATPVTLAFDLTGVANILSATLTVWGFDVDTATGERDSIVLNGRSVGVLIGKDNEAIVNTLALTASQLIAGAVNTVQIFNPMNDLGPNYGFQVYNGVDPLTHTDRRASLTIVTASVPGPIAGAGLPVFAGLAGFMGWRRTKKRDFSV